jgi:hypothetical protein
MWQWEAELWRALNELEQLRQQRMAQVYRLIAEGRDATACRESVARISEATRLLGIYIQNAPALRN